MPLAGFDVAFAALKRQVAAAEDATIEDQMDLESPES
jgi:hypothetical protein